MMISLFTESLCAGFFSLSPAIWVLYPMQNSGSWESSWDMTYDIGKGRTRENQEERNMLFFRVDGRIVDANDAFLEIIIVFIISLPNRPCINKTGKHGELQEADRLLFRFNISHLFWIMTVSLRCRKCFFFQLFGLVGSVSGQIGTSSRCCEKKTELSFGSWTGRASKATDISATPTYLDSTSSVKLDSATSPTSLS